MDFLDMNGKVILPTDKIEFWSTSYKDWVPAEVLSVSSIWTTESQEFDGKWVQRPVLKTSIKVQAEYNLALSSGRKYHNYSPQKLTKPENIRKV